MTFSGQALRKATATSPFAGMVAAPEAAPTATTGYAAALLDKSCMTDDVVITDARALELEKVLMFLDRGYGSHTVLQYCSIQTEGSPNEIGRTLLTIPQSAFFGTDPGFFQLRLAWPKEDNAGIPTVKVTLNYRIGADGNNVLLQPGAGTGAREGWTNINSGQLSIQELVEAGFIADDCIADIYKFVADNLGNDGAILTLTPQSDVVIALRGTIVSPNSTPIEGAKGKRIVALNDKKPGDDANLGMAGVHFQNVKLLPRISGLLLDANQKAALTPKLGIHDLMARYGVKSRAVAVPDAGVIAAFDAGSDDTGI